MNAHSSNLILTTVKPKVGRPPKYSGDLLPIANAMARLGATDKELMDELDVNQSTINKWRRDHKEFSLACEEGKLAFDTGIVRGLARKAMWRMETKQAHHFDKDTGTWHVLQYEEEVAPDTASMMIWLKNRLPRQWRDKIEIDQMVDVNHKIEGDSVDSRTLAIALLNVLADAKREHTTKELIDVTPNREGHQDRAQGTQGQPAGALDASDTQRQVREDDGRATAGAVAPESVEGDNRARRERRRARLMGRASD